VADAGTLAPGDALTLVFAKGRARARVDSTDPTGEA
jgi:hypothetical protein